MLFHKPHSKLSAIATARHFRVSVILQLAIILVVFVFNLIYSTPVLADTFGCFEGNACAEGKKALSQSKDYERGKDYNTSLADRSSNVTVLSFHGGCVEPYTSEISKELSERYKWNRYNFKGKLRGTSIPECYEGTENGFQQQRKNFKILHITSTNFDDSEAVGLVKKYALSVSIHGYKIKRDETRGYTTGTICVGGRNKPQVNEFIKYIKNSKADLPYPLIPIDARYRDDKCQVCGLLQGTKPENIVNKNKSGKGGLQIELSYGLRRDLVMGNGAKFENLQNVVYEAVKEAMKSS